LYPSGKKEIRDGFISYRIMTGAKYLIVSTGVLLLFFGVMGSVVKAGEVTSERIKLPAPCYEGKTSLETALRERRSVRDYKNEPLTIAEISQLLWAA
jgi:hypothetical protein